VTGVENLDTLGFHASVLHRRGNDGRPGGDHRYRGRKHAPGCLAGSHDRTGKTSGIGAREGGVDKPSRINSIHSGSEDVLKIVAKSWKRGVQ
jgi:hypothetical protein